MACSICLLCNFALGFVRRIIDLRLKALKQTLQESIHIAAFVLQLMSMGDMPSQVGKHNAPCEGVLPRAAADTDVLPLFRDPDPKNLKRRPVALCDRRNA
jgi:hypothetical protein